MPWVGCVVLTRVFRAGFQMATVIESEEALRQLLEPFAEIDFCSSTWARPGNAVVSLL